MIRLFTLFVLSLTCLSGFSQERAEPEKPFKIAIIAPLYLDNAFDDDNEIKEVLPRQMSAGLEFIHGAEIALSIVNTRGKKIDAYFFDSQSEETNLRKLIDQGKLADMDFIIGGVREPEFQTLALYTRNYQIPFISAIYPNDGGIRNDSFLIIMNSTLQTNIEAIYSYAVQKHSLHQIVLIKQRNDDRIDDMFKALNRRTGKNLLKINSIAVDSINATQLAMLVDTLKPALIIGATLNEAFASTLADAVYPYKKNVSLIGMPNWDGFRSFYDTIRYSGFPIMFTTPHIDEQNKLADYLNNEYFTEYRSKATPVAIRGFEATYYFTNLLLKYGKEFMSFLNENEFAPFHKFDFKPVSLTNNGSIDFYENKHIFIVQIENGEIVRSK